MTLDELYSKWLVGPREIDGVIVNAPGQPRIKIMRNIHQPPLGDFIEEYIKHQNIPKWRRKWDWKIVNDVMKGALNYIQIEYVGDRA